MMYGKKAMVTDRHVETMPMSSPEEAARRLLDSISESLDFDPRKLARVEGQFITRSGNQVYPVRINRKTVYVTVPEE